MPRFLYVLHRKKASAYVQHQLHEHTCFLRKAGHLNKVDDGLGSLKVKLLHDTWILHTSGITY
ncbi:hypothetical protein SAMN06295960_2012 [Paenibacillus aquistagni]|uniref:Uncharacterized protein n=1 Tax=Paenibacillus aquistagni TaxID=1852522 RepID=A0A1X7K448_9BACL|nr:hypothetical protein SAMN06295960_2012 [Paenibacillus aquistagni]